MKCLPRATLTFAFGFLLATFGDDVSSAPASMGAIGDSHTQPYKTRNWSGMNWVELIASSRSNEVDFGAPQGVTYRNIFADGALQSHQVLQRGYHSGVAGQMPEYAVINIGSGDFVGFGGNIYGRIYNDTDPDPSIDRYLANMTEILDGVAGTLNDPTGVKVILTNVVDWGVLPEPTPFQGTTYPDAEKREAATERMKEVNSELAAIAHERGIPVVDFFGLNSLGLDETVTVGGVVVKRDLSGGVDNLYLDGFHLSTILHGLVANTTLEAANRAYGAEFTPLSDQEILTAAEASSGQSIGFDKSVETYFDVSQFVLIETAPLVLDFDGNGILNTADIDALTGEIIAPTGNSAFELTSDDTVNHADLSKWRLEAAKRNGFSEAYLLGDSDLDGSVDSEDLNSLALSWRQSVSKWSGGDFTANGVVDSADLNALALNWRQSIPSASALSAAVPEPSAWLLALFGLPLVRRRPRCN